MSSAPSDPPAERPLTECLIGLGANVGDLRKTIGHALAAMKSHPELAVTGVSQFYRSTAVGGPENQSAFLNGAVLLKTRLSPEDLLALLHRVEADLGRQRHLRWAPRTLDLDLLIYGDHVQERGSSLRIPHPWMAIRPFVLRPALDVAAKLRHPQLELTIAALWKLVSRRPSIVAVMRRIDSRDEELNVDLPKIASAAGGTYLNLYDADHVGLTPKQRIESAAEGAGLVKHAVDSTGVRPLIVEGWWDQAIIPSPESPDAAVGEASDLHKRRVALASGMVVPNVIVGFLPPSSHATDMPSDFEAHFDRYVLDQPERCPFLKIEGDREQRIHDLTAILDGLADMDLQPE